MLKQLVTVVIFGAIASAFFAVQLDRKLPELASSQNEPTSRPMTVAKLAPANGYSDIIRIPKNRDGHFYTDLMINQRSVYVLIDTGASVLALRDSDAERAGLYPTPKDFSYPVNTANGQTMAARMKVKEIELGPLRVSNAEVFILPDESLGTSLLGMNVLSQMGRVAFDQSELLIEREL